MADFGGNIVGWEGCVCGVQGICGYCKGKLRGGGGGLAAEWNVQEEMDTSSWGEETGSETGGRGYREKGVGFLSWSVVHLYTMG